MSPIQVQTLPNQCSALTAYITHFLTLGNHTVNIRRLSTVSWVKAAPGNSFGTKWTWYWKNDQNQWVPYDGANSPVASTVQNSNEILEEHFQDGNVLVVKITSKSYKILLLSLEQPNILLVE